VRSGPCGALAALASAIGLAVSAESNLGQASLHLRPLSSEENGIRFPDDGLVASHQLLKASSSLSSALSGLSRRSSISSRRLSHLPTIGGHTVGGGVAAHAATGLASHS